MRTTSLFSAALVVVMSAGCLSTPIEYEDDWMDSPNTVDASLRDVNWYVSDRLSEPTEDEKDTPVVVSYHGFGGATYNLLDLQERVEQEGYLFSNALLGGHGRNTDVFRDSTYEEWGQGPLDEVLALHELGFRHINVVTVSTGGALFLNQNADGLLDDVEFDHVWMTSSFVRPANELLYQADWVGPILHNFPGSPNDEEVKYVYRNRPWQVFTQLLDLSEKVEDHLLQEGITVNTDDISIWQADEDGAVNPISSSFISAGVNGGDVPVTVMRTDEHVFTRKRGKDDWSDDDEAAQQRFFEAVIADLDAIER